MPNHTYNELRLDRRSVTGIETLRAVVNINYKTKHNNFLQKIRVMLNFQNSFLT